MIFVAKYMKESIITKNTNVNVVNCFQILKILKILKTLISIYKKHLMQVLPCLMKRMIVIIMIYLWPSIKNQRDRLVSSD